MAGNNGNGRRWVPGQSGNPAGRPPKGMALAEEVRKLSGTTGTDLVQKLVDIANSVPDADGKGGEPAKVRIEAIKVLLDRGFGKAPQEINLNTGVASMSDDELDALPQETRDQLLALSEQADALLAGR